MNIGELLDAAKRKQGSLGKVAEAFGFNQTNLSDWRKGKRTPTAGQIAMLAELAGLPIFETLAEIEAQLDEKHASVWESALGKLRAAGVAAALILGLAICSTMATATGDDLVAGSEAAGALTLLLLRLYARQCILCQYVSARVRSVLVSHVCEPLAWVKSASMHSSEHPATAFAILALLDR